MRKIRKLAPMLLIALVVLALIATLAGCSSSAGNDAEGAGYVSGDGSVSTWPAADRRGPIDLSGRTFDSAAITLEDWRGTVVVVNFWYAACPPCRAEAPSLAKLATDYPQAHLLGVNSTDDAGTAAAFERTFAIDYPSLADHDGAAISAFQGLVAIQAVPTTLVLDAEGKVAARIVGQADPSTLDALVRQTLDEQTASPAAT